MPEADRRAPRTLCAANRRHATTTTPLRMPSRACCDILWEDFRRVQRMADGGRPGQYPEYLVESSHESSRVFHCDTTRSSLTTMFIVLSLGPFAQCVVNLDIGYLSMPSPEIPRRNLFYGPFYCFFFLFLFNRCETQKV